MGSSFSVQGNFAIQGVTCTPKFLVSIALKVQGHFPCNVMGNIRSSQEVESMEIYEASIDDIYPWNKRALWDTTLRLGRMPNCLDQLRPINKQRFYVIYGARQVIPPMQSVSVYCTHMELQKTWNLNGLCSDWLRGKSANYSKCSWNGDML